MKHGTNCLIWIYEGAPLIGTYLAPQWIAGQRVATVSVGGVHMNFAAEIVTDTGQLADALKRGSLVAPGVGRA